MKDKASRKQLAELTDRLGNLEESVWEIRNEVDDGHYGQRREILNLEIHYCHKCKHRSIHEGEFPHLRCLTCGQEYVIQQKAVRVDLPLNDNKE